MPSSVSGVVLAASVFGCRVFAAGSARRFSRCSSRVIQSASALRRSSSLMVDAVDAQRALDEHAVARKPGRLAARCRRAACAPGPISWNVSRSSSTYCCSFFQLSSRRASTRDMKASRSVVGAAGVPWALETASAARPARLAASDETEDSWASLETLRRAKDETRPSRVSVRVNHRS